MKIKNTNVSIVQGDITALDVEAIVNPANSRLTMSAGVAGAIKAKGGSDIEAWAIKQGPVAAGEAVTTTAGSLKAQHIIHAVTMDQDLNTDEHKIRRAASQALKLAQKLNIKSLALPALGCGTGGFPAVAAAKILAQEILKFIRYENSKVREITVCLLDQTTYQSFHQTILGYMTHIEDTLGEGPYVTVDAIIEWQNSIVLIERSNPPYGLALPGGFVDYGESLEEAVIREAKEETNLDLIGLKQFHTYSSPDRDPRFHTVSTVFTAQAKGTPRSGDDAKGLQIVKISDVLNLEYAFDHRNVMKDYLNDKRYFARLSGHTSDH